MEHEGSSSCSQELRIFSKYAGLHEEKLELPTKHQAGESPPKGCP
jgi:hypothetical protein